MAKLILLLFSPLLRRCYREGESNDERFRKNLVIPIFTTMALLLVLFLPYNASDTTAVLAVSIVSIVLLLSAVARTCYTKHLPLSTVEALVAYIGLVEILFSDLVYYGTYEVYVAAVLIMDLYLLTGCRRPVIEASRGVVVLYLIVTSSEQAFGYGLYQTMPRLTKAEVPETKGATLGISLMLFRLFVFLADFAMTRYFARNAENQQRTMQASINLAQLVANRLLLFDLDGAEELVQGTGDVMPEELRVAFVGLLRNLQSYKPFLPQSCLPQACVSEREASDEESEKDFPLTLLSTVSSHGSNDVLHITHRMHRAALEQRKHVTQVALNIRGFLDVACAIHVPDLVNFYDSFITTVLDCVGRAKGQCEIASGDHLTCTFNGARPLVQHGAQAVACVVDLTDHLHTLFADDSNVMALRVSVGVATGEALCGTLGCAMLARYMVIGAVASWVHRIEQRATSLEEPILLCNSLRGVADQSYHCRLVELAEMSGGGPLVPLWAPTHPKEVENEEWMYQIEKNANKWSTYNSVLSALLHGDGPAAREAARDLDESIPENRALLERIRTRDVT